MGGPRRSRIPVDPGTRHVPDGDVRRRSDLPGEPFHAIEVDDRWLIDWYQVRTVGIALFGPSPAEVVPPISKDEYVEAVRRHLLEPDWVDDFPAHGDLWDRSYAILSMCRGLRTCLTGEHVSKREGARWASELMPEHAGLIADALTWRERSQVSGVGSVMTHEVTRRFVIDVQRQLR